MKEKVTLTFDRYRDNDGNPTCAVNFKTGEICQFYATQRFGINETCIFAPPSWRGTTSIMERRPNDGTLIPGDWCPLFKE